MPDSVSQIIVEIINGDALPLSQAARRVPAYRGEGTASPSTAWRWATAGAKTPDGRIVKLETARIGGRMLTSTAALARVATALTVAPSDAAPTPTPKKRTPSERKKAEEASHRRLAAAGA